MESDLFEVSGSNLHFRSDVELAVTSHLFVLNKEGRFT